MTFWLIAAALCIFAALFLWGMMARAGGEAAPETHYDIEIYRDQLDELERDRSRGLISDAEAEAGAIEIKRRILAAADVEAASQPPGARNSGRQFAILAVAAVPLAGFGGYMLIGRPDLATAPAAVVRGPTQDDIRRAQNLTPAQRRQMIRGMVEGLEARLKANPKNFAGWMRLGRAWSVLQEWKRAADAYARARELKRDDVPALEGFIAARLRGVPQNKPLPEDLREAVGDLALKWPNHPLALYLGGIAAAERGQVQIARLLWQRLLTVLPKGSPLIPVLKRRIDALPKANPPAKKPE